MNLHNVSFIKSAAAPNAFLRDSRPQIVFAGKSNVGKSSLINKILNRKNFARVGASPGKTIHINYFLVDSCAYFVDLPGYGYAKVSRGEKERWAKLMEQYFAESDLISGAVMLVDCRHKPTADDYTMAQWFKAAACPLVVAANKADKVKKSEMEGNLKCIREFLELEDDIEIIPVSAETGFNRDKLIGIIERLAERKTNIE